MSYNYAAEKKKFDCEWEKTKAWYRECGMSEESISEMYEFDCMEFRRQRTRLTREQPMFYLTEGGQEVNILESFPENISKISVNDKYRFYDGEYGWIDEIDNRKAQEVIFRMKELDKKILALLIDGYSQISIAKILCVKPLKIYRHVEKLRGILSEIYAVS